MHSVILALRGTFFSKRKYHDRSHHDYKTDGRASFRPYWNKGTAFTTKEREEFDLVGRLPYRINSLDQQCEASMFSFWCIQPSHLGCDVCSEPGDSSRPRTHLSRRTRSFRVLRHALQHLLSSARANIMACRLKIGCSTMGSSHVI